MKADIFINNRNWKNNRNIHSVTTTSSQHYMSQSKQTVEVIYVTV